MSDAFYNSSSIFLNYLTLLDDGDQLIQLLMRCTGVRVSSVLFLRGSEGLISLFTCSNMQICVKSEHIKN